VLKADEGATFGLDDTDDARRLSTLRPTPQVGPIVVCFAKRQRIAGTIRVRESEHVRLRAGTIGTSGVLVLQDNRDRR
jgi:hypothetical protein